MSFRERLGWRIMSAVLGRGKAQALRDMSSFPLLNQRQPINPYASNHLDKEQRRVEHEVQFPWLYNPNQYWGAPRDVDVIEFRRLASAPIVQLCEGAVAEEVKKTPWSIIERDQSEKSIDRLPPHKRSHQSIVRARKRLQQKAQKHKSLQHDIDEVSSLLSSPNENQDSFPQLVNQALTDQMEVGDGCWVLAFEEGAIKRDRKNEQAIPTVKKGSKPLTIMGIDNLMFNKKVDEYGIVSGYVQTAMNTPLRANIRRQKTFSKKQIVWFTNDKRPNRVYGYGEVEKVSMIVDLLLLSLEQETDYFSEGMLSPGALALDGEGWTDDKVEELKEEIREKGKGHPEYFLMFNRPASWIQFSYTYRELQMHERQLWQNKQIAGLFGLNTRFIGLGEESGNRATAFADRTIAMERGISPKLKNIEHSINTQLLWRFWSDQFAFVYDPSLGLEEKKMTSEISSLGYTTGILTRNEARREIGEEPVDDGDEFVESPSQATDPNSIGGGYSAFGKRQTGESKEDGDEDEDDNDEDDTAGPGGHVPDGTGPHGVGGGPGGGRADGSSGVEKPKKNEKSDESQLEAQAEKLYREFWDAIIVEVRKEKSRKKKKLTSAIVSALVARVISDTDIGTRVGEVVVEFAGAQYVSEYTGLEAKFDFGGEFDETDALDRLRERRMPYFEDTDALSDEVIEVLMQGVDEGLSVDDTAAMLMDVRKDFSENRAQLVAHEEINRSRKEAVLEFGLDNKSRLNKRWRATKDHRTRASHLAMDGEMVAVDEPFMVPYHLDNKKYTTEPEMYPGESKHGIGCRCVATLVRKEKARTYISSPSEAPEGVSVEQGQRGGYYYESGARGQTPDVGASPGEIVQSLIDNKQNIGKPKFNYKIGKAGEELLDNLFDGFTLHTEWSSAFDLSDGELVEAKTTGSGHAILNRRARERKIEAAGDRKEDIQIYMVWVKDDIVEVYTHKPDESFFDTSTDDVYTVDAVDEELVATYTADGGWEK